MLSVRLGEHEVAPLLNGELSPGRGEQPRAVRRRRARSRRSMRFERKMTERGVPCAAPGHQPRVSFAMMDPIIEPFTDYLSGSLQCAGDPVHLRRERDVDHGGRGDRSRVLGAPLPRAGALLAGRASCCSQPERLFLEVGPGTHALHAGPPASRGLGEPVAVASLPDAAGGQSDWLPLLDAAGSPVAARRRLLTGPRCTATERGAARCPRTHSSENGSGSTRLPPSTAPRSARKSSANPVEAPKTSDPSRR